MKKNEYNFDAFINRLNTDSLKWDEFKDLDVIPLWVADMDFASPPSVINAVTDRVKHGIFGYTHSPDKLNDLIASYVMEQFNWKIDPDWIVLFPNAISVLYLAATELIKKNDHILVPTPVYNHLKNAAYLSERKFSEVPLSEINQRLIIEADQLKNFKKDNSRLFLFCNPQNPGGTVYSKKELTDIANFCIEHNLLICSDEVHAGLVLDDFNHHIPIASLSKEISLNTVTIMSLNKTFNFSGEGMAWIVCENQKIREKIQKDLHTKIPAPSLFSYIITQEAIVSGEGWRKELISYLRNNRDLLYKELTQVPQIKLFPTEAGYLSWINCEKMQIEDPYDFFLQKGIALMPGKKFNSSLCVRLNFGTRREVILKAIYKIKSTFNL